MVYDHQTKCWELGKVDEQSTNSHNNTNKINAELNLVC